MAKITGTVKWFSNKKGFGFIAPTSDNSPTNEEIFVHQTSIFSDGDYRTLVEGSEVEFEIEKEDSGKLKAINVTSPGGTAIKPPSRDRKRPPKKENKDGSKNNDAGDNGEDVAVSGDAENGERKDRKNGERGRRRRAPKAAKKPVEEGGDVRENQENLEAPKKEREPPFHSVIGSEEKQIILSKGIDLGQKMTIDIALGDARIKLGQGGYAGLAHASGMVGEGTYNCSEKGLVTFEWERCLEFINGNWTPGALNKLLPSFSLATDNVVNVNQDETAESLWGADKTDPKDAFVENGFKMKRVVLTRPPGGRGRRRGRPAGGRNGKAE